MELNIDVYTFNLKKLKNYCIKNRLKLSRFIILLISFVLLLYIVISPIYKINEIKYLVKSDSLLMQNYHSAFNSPELEPLLRERTYKQALVKLAEQDSVHLVVNLCDSLVCLSIKGVIIYQRKINHFKTDQFLGYLPPMEYASLFSQPLRIHSQYATIVKEPIVVRHAPKDTLEVALNAYKPDTLIQNPAFLQLKTDYGIRVVFQQEANPTLKDKWFYFRFNLKLYMENIFYKLLGMICFEKPSFSPRIIVKIPTNDLRAIYRALPNSSFLVLKYSSK